MAKILIVEDDRSLALVIGTCLKADNHLTDHVADGLGALGAVRVHDYDLVILDWGLPDVSGISVCRQMRESRCPTPVLMLTARGTPSEKAEGLDAGADDFLVKPFNPTELLARVRALLRRPRAVVSFILNAGPLRLDMNTLEASNGEHKALLSAKEAAILELLMRYPNQSFTAEALLQRLWSSDSNSSLDTVRTHVKTLRKKLRDSDEKPLIRSTRNIGYRLSIE